MRTSFNPSSSVSVPKHRPAIHAAIARLPSLLPLPDNTATIPSATEPATPPPTPRATPAPTTLNPHATPPCNTIEYRKSEIENLLSLSPHQHHALELLAAGHPDSDVARELNLHRTTIYRWRTQHPAFIAQLSQLASAHRNATVSECLDVALHHILDRLRKKGSKSSELAIKLLCSPRFARLAAEASAPRALRDVLTEITAATRLDPTPEDLPAVLHEVDQSISAPFLPELPPPPPQPKAPPKPSVYAQSCQQRDERRNRPPRPELLDALKDCGLDLPGPVLDAVIRRPDLEPFDVYYRYAQCRYQPDYVPYHFLCVLDSTGGTLPGVYCPLDPDDVAQAYALAKGKLTHLGPHNLAGCELSGTKELLTAKRNNQPILTIPRENLWRDTVLYPHPPIPAAA